MDIKSFYYKFMSYVKRFYSVIKDGYENILNSKTTENIKFYLLTLIKDIGGIKIQEKYEDKMNRQFEYAKSLDYWEAFYSYYGNICKNIGEVVHNAVNFITINPATEKLEVDDEILDLKDMVKTSRTKRLVLTCKDIMTDAGIPDSYIKSYIIALSVVYPYYMLIDFLKGGAKDVTRVKDNVSAPGNHFMEFGLDNTLFKQSFGYYVENDSLSYIEKKLFDNVSGVVKKFEAAETETEQKFELALGISKLFFGFLFFYLGVLVIHMSSPSGFLKKFQFGLILISMLIVAISSVMTSLIITEDEPEHFENINKME